VSEGEAGSEFGVTLGTYFHVPPGVREKAVREIYRKLNLKVLARERGACHHESLRHT
jgi:hypothetical protein